VWCKLCVRVCGNKGSACALMHVCVWLSTNDSYLTDTCPDDQAWLPSGEPQQVCPDLHAGGICVGAELQLLPLADWVAQWLSLALKSAHFGRRVIETARRVRCELIKLQPHSCAVTVNQHTGCSMRTQWFSLADGL
jgi:hypothetical protein